MSEIAGEKDTMRPIIVAFVFAAALTAAPLTASAQSPHSYAWCAKYFTRGTPTSCYYATQQLCMATVSGIGGYCYLNPGYRGAAVSPRYYSPRYYSPQRYSARHYRHRRY
jgi:Protein of unknown function (DUF3551)